MAEELETAGPDLSALRADLDASLAGSVDSSSMVMPDNLPAKPESIDIYKNSVGNPITGSNPGISFNSASDFANASLKATSTQPQNEYASMRPFTYSGDYDGANFDRYYGTKAYKTLGFSPYRDNDALYNQKMTYGDQFVRAASQFDDMVFGAIAGGVRSWGTMFTDPLAPDIAGARDMARSNAIGTMTQGGFGAFVGNTFLNSAYSIGIGLEFLAEEAVLAAATAFSGGLAGEVTLPAMAARGGMLGRQLLKVGELGAKFGGKADKFGDAAKMFEKTKDFAKVSAKASGGNDVNSAREFFGKVARGAFDIVNPLESTVDALKSTRYANDLAKTVGTAGAFIDDIIKIKTAASEAKLEGGFVKIDATEKLIDQYREMHGKDPEGEDLQKIEDLSSIEARRATLYNFPAIMTTNKLLFSTILYPLKKVTGTASTRVLQDIVAEDGMKALAQNPFKLVGKGAGAQLKAVAKSFAKPGAYGSYGMTYLKANVGEGLQENIQEAISQGAINHALAVQKDPTMAAYRGYMGYMMDALKDQVSAQGAETFASGFLMGAFTQPIMSAPAWAVAKGIDKFKNKDARDKAKKERDTALLQEQTTLNEMANNDILYWAPDIATAVKNGTLSKDMTEAASIGDIKASKDAKFRLEFNHIATALRSGKFEDLMTKLADYKNLSPTEALEAFGRYGLNINTEEEASKALDQMDGVIERARNIKANYEMVAQEFPNPYNLSGVKADPVEMVALISAHRAWEEAQQNLVFANSEFQEYSERISNMTDAFSSIASTIAKGDVQNILALTSIRNLANEVSLLNKEIANLDTVEGQASVKKEKEKIRDILKDFGESIVDAQNKIKDENITDYSKKQLVYQESKKKFNKYVAFLAKKNDSTLFNKTADEAFTLLTDTLEMRDEQHRLADSINVLSNPKGFLTLQKRLQEAFADHHTKKEETIAENLKEFTTRIDENAIIQGFGKMGLKIPEDFLAEYKEALNAKKPIPLPTYFIDPKTQSNITPESNPEKFAEGLELWKGFKAWMESSKEIQSEEELAEIAAVNAEEDAKAIKTYNTYNQILQDNLTGIYNTAKAEGKIKEDVSFATFLHSYPDALLEVALNKTKEDLEREASQKVTVDDGIPLGTDVNPEARLMLNQLGYTNTKIDSLSREQREEILKGGIPVEDYYKGAKALIEERRALAIKGIHGIKRVSKNKTTISWNTYGAKDGIFFKQTNTEEELKNEINAKYDAELKALEAKPVEKVTKKESTKGYTQTMPGGGTVTFNKELRTWEFRNRNGKLITSKKAVAKKIDELSGMPGIISTWWTNFLTNEERVEVKEAFDNVAYRNRGEAEAVEKFIVTEEEMLMEALQGVVFRPEALTDLTNVGLAWQKGNGYQSIDDFVNTSLNSTYQSYGKSLPDDTGDLIEDAKDMIRVYEKGIRDKDIKEYKKRINSNQDITDLEEDFADKYGLGLMKTYLKLDSLDLLKEVEIPVIETTPKENRQPIINPGALKPGDVVIDDKDNEYTVLGFIDATSGVYSPDDNVTFPGEPAELITEDKNGKQVSFYDGQIRTLSVKSYGKKQTTVTEPVQVVEDLPIADVNPVYEGKVIFITPGSGKTKLARNNKNVIDTDQLLLEAITELQPDFPISDTLSAGQNIYDAVRHGGVNRKALYDKVRPKIKEMADKGFTVLTSSTEFMKNSDFLFIQTEEKFILDKYDRMKEINELDKLGDPYTIAITEDISTAIKKAPEELMGIMDTLDTETETAIEPTITDINQNITSPNLATAQEKGYDAIYQNKRYAIIKVDENSVTLKSMDDTAIIVKPEEITAVTKAEDVVTTTEENNDFKKNQEILKTKTFDINDDADDLNAAADDISNNIC
jgi:hypothetical protein